MKLQSYAALCSSLIGFLSSTAKQALGSEDLMMTSTFFDASQLFDATLKAKKEPKDIEILTNQYRTYLQKLTGTITADSPFLSEAIQREIQRLDAVKAEYHTNQEKFARIRLAHNWPDCRQYKEAANDFRKVLGVNVEMETPSRRPDLEPNFGNGVMLFGKPFLCPLASFVTAFAEVEGLRTTNSRTLIGMPGFPKNSFYYHSYDGDFTSQITSGGGPFKRMYVVTDVWDQVVAVQFTSEAPQGYSGGSEHGIRTFNFVLFRQRGTPQSYVNYRVSSHQNSSTILTTSFRDRNGLKEINVLYLPPPTRSLIAYSLSFP